MAGPFSLITGGLLGEQNPEDAIAAWADAQQARNRGAIGLDANGNPVAQDPNAWARVIQPGSDPNGAQASQSVAAGQAAASGVQQPNQEPNATKTPPSLGHLMMDLQQYNEREQGFNQALGGGFAAFSQPRDREWVSKMFNVNLPDPLKFGQSQMDWASQQQGQDRANAIGQMVNDPIRGPQIAAQLHMDWGALKAGLVTDPGMVGKIAQALGMPTAEMSTLSQLQHMGGTAGGGGLPGGATASDIASLKTLALAGVAPDFARKMVADQINYRNTHGGQEAPYKDNVAAYNRYVADQEERQASAADFGKTHGQNIDKVTEFQHRVEALQNNPGMIKIANYSQPYKALVKRVLQHPEETVAQAAAALPQPIADFAGLPNDVLAAIDEIRQLKGQEYATALHSIGTRFSTQEVQGVQSGMDQLSNVELNPDTYQEQVLNKLVDSTKTIRANSHGAAQDFDTMDPDLRTYVNPTFTKGGRRNIEGSGSEDWADKVKPPQAEIDAAADAVKHGASRAAVERRMRSKGFRPMGF